MIYSIIVFFLISTIAAPLLGKYIAFIYSYGSRKQRSISKVQSSSKAPSSSKVPSSILSSFYNAVINKLLASDISSFENRGQNWRQYFRSLMIFNFICIIATFCIIYFQESLPLNGNIKNSISFSGALNASVSFATGTFWQSHDASSQLSIFAHIFALTMQNFLSGSCGIAVFIAFTRGIINSKNSNIGNFYEDFLKAMIFIVMPLALIFAIFFVSQGVVFDFTGHLTYKNFEGVTDEILLGPAAAQMSIKNLIANGGSIFSSASAHPFESPSRAALMVSVFLVFIVPSAMIFVYGYMVDALKLSWALYSAVVLIVIISLLVIYLGETSYALPLILDNNNLTDDFNYAGKEMIYDKFPSLMWTLSITMSSCGSPNACLENFSPLSTLVLFSNLVMGKFIIEGVGSGFFAMLSYLIVAIFLRGLITGQTANFFGKRITINEINYVVIVFLIMPVGVLLFTGVTLMLPFSRDIITYGGSQAVTDITYNFASSFANNGSSFSGIDISNDYFNYMTALAMFIGRYPIIYFSLAISGSFAKKRRLSSDVNIHLQSSIELAFFLVLTVFMVGAIMYTPLIILGPLLEFINL